MQIIWPLAVCMWREFTNGNDCFCKGRSKRSTKVLLMTTIRDSIGEMRKRRRMTFYIDEIMTIWLSSCWNDENFDRSSLSAWLILPMLDRALVMLRSLLWWTSSFLSLVIRLNLFIFTWSFSSIFTSDRYRLLEMHVSYRCWTIGFDRCIFGWIQ